MKKFTIIANPESDHYYESIKDIQTAIKADDYKIVLWDIFYVLLRYKHKEEELEKKYGNKILEYIDSLRSEIYELLESRSINLDD